MVKKLYSDEELLDGLRESAADLGRPPSQKEMNDSGPYSDRTYADRFGSWNEALGVAGLETGTNDPDGRPPTPKKELLTDLKAVAEIAGEAPSTRIYRKHGDYTVKTFCKRFGGWNPALRAAGFEPNVEINLSDQTLITALQEFAEELGQAPTIVEMEQRGPYTAGPYKRAFGSWNRALQEAGLEVHQARDVDKCDLISELKRLAEELGHVPRRDEMRNQGDWSATVYQERFGSWNGALQVAGFDQNQRWGIPREELLVELRAVAEELGHPPTTTEMNKYGMFTSDPYQRVFGGWRTALQAADPDYLEGYCQSDTETVPFGSN